MSGSQSVREFNEGHERWFELLDGLIGVWGVTDISDLVKSRYANRPGVFCMGGVERKKGV